MNIVGILSIIEAIYIVYMLRYFKTTHSFEYGNNLDNLYIIASMFGMNKDYIKHTTTSSNIPKSHICRFGKDVSWIISIFFILRAIIFFTNNDVKYWSWNTNIFIVAIIFVVSFMNFNVVVYLLPIFAIEIYLIVKYKSKKSDKPTTVIDKKINNKIKELKQKQMDKKLKNIEKRKELVTLRELKRQENLEKNEINKIKRLNLNKLKKKERIEKNESKRKERNQKMEIIKKDRIEKNEIRKKERLDKLILNRKKKNL